MRNIVFLLFALFGLFLLSCSSKEHKTGPGISKTVETTVDCVENIPSTAPRWGCDGRKIDGQKITGWTTESTPTTKAVDCGFTDEDLKASGYTYTGASTRASRPERIEEEGFTPTPAPDSGTKKSNSGWSIPWEWLKWLIFLAVGLALILVLLWLLRELVDWLFSQRMPRNPQGDTGVYVMNPPVTTPPVAPVNPTGTWVPEGSTLLGPRMICIPEDGVYLGIRSYGEAFRGEISPTEEQTNTQT